MTSSKPKRRRLGDVAARCTAFDERGAGLVRGRYPEVVRVRVVTDRVEGSRRLLGWVPAVRRVPPGRDTRAPG